LVRHALFCAVFGKPALVDTGLGGIFAIGRLVYIEQGDLTQVIVLIKQGIGIECLLNFSLQFQLG